MGFDWELPSGWRWTTIEEIQAPMPRAVVTGPFGSSIGSKYFVEAGVPVIRGNNLSLRRVPFVDGGFVFLTEEKASEFKNLEAHPGDLVFTAAGTIGQVGLIPNKTKYPRYIISNKQMRVRLNSDLVRPLFAYYWFTEPSVREHIISRNTGSTIPLINLSVLRSLRIPLPSINVQDEIISVITPLDERIRLLENETETLEAVATGIFQSWFVDFDPVHAKAEGRQPEGMSADIAALFPSELVDSELGPIPKGWQIGPLREMCAISSGKRPLARADSRTDEFNIPLYGGGGLMGFTTESNSSESCILTGRVGTLGEVEVAFPPFWASDNVLVISPTEERRLPFCLHWVKGIDIRALNRGSTQPLLTQKDLGSQLGVIPPNLLIDIFDGIGSSILNKIRSHEIHAETLKELRDILLPRLLSGAMPLPA